MGGTTLDINPTLFNFFSDVLSVLIRACFSFAIAFIFSFLMSWHLFRNRSESFIPLTLLGFVPDDFFQAAQFTERLRSLPAFILLLLLVLADFSHSIGDLGLNFVTVQKIGPQETVLSMNFEDRNHQRLLQLSGDPLMLRTLPRADINFRDDPSLDSDLNLVITKFLRGTDGIARGYSPFVTLLSTDNRKVSWNGASYHSIFRDDDTAVVFMNLTVPVTCSSSQMVSIPQIIETSPLLDSTVRSTALAPNCTVNEVRDSGIHPTVTSEKRVETVELAYKFASIEVDTFLTLSNSGSEFHNFTLTPANRQLARDRANWKEGRRIEGVFDGLRVGSLQIDLGAIVLATGRESLSEYEFDRDAREFIWNRRNTILMVGQILGECPPRPSGLPTTGMSCIAFVETTCDAFPEDYQVGGGWSVFGESDTDVDSKCELGGVDIMWGRNFVADAELVAMVAAIYSRVQPHPFEVSDQAQFKVASVQAATFALGTLKTLPSVQETVNPNINALYFAFNLIPLIVACIVAAVAHSLRKKRLDVPIGAWELMVLAKEQNTINPRQDSERRKKKYPKEDETLALTLTNDRSGGVVVLSDQKHKRRSLNFIQRFKNDREQDSVSETGSNSIGRPDDGACVAQAALSSHSHQGSQDADGSSSSVEDDSDAAMLATAFGGDAPPVGRGSRTVPEPSENPTSNTKEGSDSEADSESDSENEKSA